MLSRRHLRVKVLHALYAYFQSDNKNLSAGEKELLLSVDKVYDLYLFQLSLLPELAHQASLLLEERKKKRLPTKEDLNPNLKFVNNRVLEALARNAGFQQALDKRRVNWVGEQDLVKKLFLEISKSPEYQKYMDEERSSFESDKAFAIEIFKNFIIPSEALDFFYEEKSIYWVDDYELVNSMVIKTLKALSEENLMHLPLLKLYGDDEAEDREFITTLFRKTISNSHEYEEIVASKTENWELERIALMDIIIMKMAVCELTTFSQIPVKVTLNEYIELSKSYSTPKSKVFVNGVLDKIVADLKKNGKILKTGRGLLE